MKIIGLVFPRGRFCESNSSAMRKSHCNKTICPLGRHVEGQSQFRSSGTASSYVLLDRLISSGSFATLAAIRQHIGDAIHIFDYAIIGFLIACVIWAGAMALHKAR